MGRATQDRTNDEQPRSANEVRLRGRVSTAPEERVLPSGTLIVTFRVSVAREASPMTNGSRQTSDWVDCTAWGAKARRAASRWRAGDVVEVEGALRRRFQRGAAGTSTRLEVEVLSGRLVTRAEQRTAVAAPAAG
jgi:single-strand DNA-binding protein